MRRGLEAISGRLSARVDEVADAMVARYRREIPEYSTLDDAILADVRHISALNMHAVLAELDADQLEEARAGAARRVHHGVSLESLLHAYRIWGQGVWNAILETADPADPEEREAALMMAGRIIEHIDVVSTVAARAYLDEAQSLWREREVLRRDLLDALISGQAASRQAAALRVELAEGYIVVLARGEQDDRDPRAVRTALRRALDNALRHLMPDEGGAVLAGLRHSEVVALYPAEGRAGLERVRTQAAALAEALAPLAFKLGVGGWHAGLGGVATSYAEAREAVGMALRGGATRLVVFDDVIVDHILRSSPHADRVLTDTLGPLQDYDAKRTSALLPTLRAYVESAFNVTRAAAALHVHPNTVVYRLGRIRDLTGRDPHDPDDLLVLSLALRLAGPPDR